MRPAVAAGAAVLAAAAFLAAAVLSLVVTDMLGWAGLWPSW